MGQSGGIVVMWNAENINLEVLLQTSQEIHSSAQVNPSKPPSKFFAVYASTCFQNKLTLWNNLRAIFDDIISKDLP